MGNIVTQVAVLSPSAIRIHHGIRDGLLNLSHGLVGDNAVVLVHIDLNHSVAIVNSGDHTLEVVVLIVAGQTAGSGGLAGAAIV